MRIINSIRAKLMISILGAFILVIISILGVTMVSRIHTSRQKAAAS